ncbi:MAG: putative rRNA maturation factor [Candidatus Roizmanbacteria bacterium GW2011_GWC2_37_13]|uniref:Putative rRNA maturation factor n=1 Tax=Candidatus Roizmanbacteria bacterium GW2011_GWC2_37_13 TaxID=1618486 RepID=A0A0G0GDP7_9BACT|nr:MAG: putative rRNA maturation factor [Candidatus Roizmanbacteria bacterium GW2011_GWC1_37_12]KKQ24165.1 MAG: putative rRNA maturation factor [Candidatus Roizmanbacteria bacterium GW2011_GWC2_37_13]
MVNLISSSRYRLDRNRTRKLVADILSAKGISETYTLNLIFVGRNKMKKLAETYKKEQEALPVLSFAYDEKDKDGEVLLGEIIVCYPQAVLLAAERNRKVEETIISLIKHGVENLLK